MIRGAGRCYLRHCGTAEYGFGETTDSVAALEMIRAYRPRVALINDRIPGYGTAVAAVVHREGRPTRVRILTGLPAACRGG
ncbi:hypothetical protein [Mycolicibacterium sp. 120320]|uniref:hypothetical protein n=1 Tax=Mycolicibacterium sp. 120320 TaxID=3096110 RepID=UPI002ED7FD54